MNVRDWAEFSVTLMAAIGWFISWSNHRRLKFELRGVRGYKFRVLWRAYAKEHDIPINGEDSD